MRELPRNSKCSLSRLAENGNEQAGGKEGFTLYSFDFGLNKILITS